MKKILPCPDKPGMGTVAAETGKGKCLIGVEETKDGQPTGKTLAYEFHGNYQGLLQFILKCESEYGKQALLPMEEMEVENQCGYIFKGSTNQMTYIE